MPDHAKVRYFIRKRHRYTKTQRLIGASLPGAQKNKGEAGAREGTRTPIPLLASGPKPGASTNFATLAERCIIDRTSFPASLLEDPRGLSIQFIAARYSTTSLVSCLCFYQIVPSAMTAPSRSNDDTDAFLSTARCMTAGHYENFPVASLLLPAHLRPAVKAIYAFARSADDIADEGDAKPAQRLAALAAYEQELDDIALNRPSRHPLFTTLAAVIHRYQLPLTPFRHLLSAFKQDVLITRYQSFADLLDYCRRSANPIGALMLHLYQAATPDNLHDADAICSALQLINFWQDVAIDWRKQRIYLPQEDLQRFGVDERAIADAVIDDAWRSLMRFEIDRTRSMMLSALPLARRLPGRIGWELRMVMQGGLRILQRLEQADGDVFRQRPTLGARDWGLMLWRALIM